jgi:nitrate reductase (cytochrome), electron transfer subunit
MSRPGASRLVLIGLAVILMAAAVYVVGSSIQAGQREALLLPARAEPTPEIPFEAGVFRRTARALDYAAMPEAPPSRRTLAVYYSRRAFPGAPPVIPHPIGDAGPLDGGCLACHRDGGWVPHLGAYAPVVPHPELTSCRQCHVPQETPGVFRATTWKRGVAPAVNRAALPGSPPPIPHGLEMRANCVACHGGPGAVVEIRTTHPERVSCRQCHALGAERPAAFARPGPGGGG